MTKQISVAYLDDTTHLPDTDGDFTNEFDLLRLVYQKSFLLENAYSVGVEIRELPGRNNYLLTITLEDGAVVDIHVHSKSEAHLLVEAFVNGTITYDQLLNLAGDRQRSRVLNGRVSFQDYFEA